jgi:hypothetical protein
MTIKEIDVNILAEQMVDQLAGPSEIETRELGVRNAEPAGISVRVARRNRRHRFYALRIRLFSNIADWQTG